MTGRNMRVQRQTAAAQGLLGGMTAIAREAAKDNDAGNLGVDGWIRTGHRFIDMGVRAYAGFLQAAIAGPWWNTQSPTGEPLPPEPIPVKERNYPRKLTVVKRFVRVGMPGMRIPNDAIKFEPEVLRSGEKQFRIKLLDYDFVGANYTGTIGLSPVGSPGGASREEIERTIGF